MAEVVPSVCPLDCPDRCSLDVTVADGRVVAIDGSERNPMTGGVICGKVRKFHRRVHGPDRVLHPAVRVGPKGPGATWRDVSWDEALALVAERFKAIIAESGPEALLPYWYAGSNGLLTGGALDQRLWNRLGVTQLQRTFCAANTGEAVRLVYGDLPSADPLDVDAASGVLLWGCNPSASGIHLVPKLNALRARGGELIVVDPRRTPLAKQASLHLDPLPGTDVALALAVAHLAFRRGWADVTFLAAHSADADRYAAALAEWTPQRAAGLCQVPVAKIEALAERYHDVSPFLLRCGWGVERNRNGTDAVRAILSLPAVFGKFGVRGGGYAMSTSSGYRMEKRWQGTPSGARSVNMSQLGRILQETTAPPIRGLFVYDCNPVATAPEQQRVIAGLTRADLFTVVHEQVWNDTCDYADVVLPATTFLEHKELSRSYGGYLLQWAEAAIPPVGEARSNHAVIAALAVALGIDEPAFRVTEDELAAEIAGTSAPGAAAWPALQRDGVVRLDSRVQFADVRPSRPLRFCDPAAPTYREPPVDAELPLALVSPASTVGISSTLFENVPAGSAQVSLHPGDAAARGIAEGDVVRLASSVGAATLVAHLDDAVRPGVASVPKGLWRRSTRDGFTANALAPAHVDPLGGGACYNDARVEITRV